ncbi:MAG: hypothetical protein QG656_1470, partial [Candidatus Hydrogenedentes bacterium]|nr:hypothetical protein [Candidatus Hydrogenedentota bacterium]
DSRPDEWTSNFIPDSMGRHPIDEFFPGHSELYLKAAASMPPFGKPVLEVVEDAVQDGRRKLKLAFVSPRKAQRVDFDVVSDIQVYAARAFGQDLDGAEEQWDASFDILPGDGFALELDVDADKPLKICVRETSFCLPAIPGMPPRPDWMMAEPNRTVDHHRPMRSEHTFSKSTFDFGPAPKQ